MSHEQVRGSTEAQRLLAQERLRPAPSEVFGARVRDRVEGSLLGSPDGTWAAPKNGALHIAAAAKPWVAIGIALSLASAIFYAWRRGNPSPSPTTSTTRPPGLPAGISTPPPEAIPPQETATEIRKAILPAEAMEPRPRAVSKHPSTAGASPRTKVATLPSPSDAPDAEAMAIESARRALTAAQPGKALQILSAAKQRFPSGALTEERQALEVIALAKLGEHSRALSAAQLFRSQFPHSLHQPLVDQATGSE